ncbi:MAG: hypothetical protein R2702_06035 [Acidimicrobiales bacterium]
MAPPWIVERIDEYTLRLGNLGTHPRRHVDITLIAPKGLTATYHLSTVEARATAELVAVGDFRKVVISWSSRWRRRRWSGAVPRATS